MVHDFDSGPAGTWKKLGPWRVVVDRGAIRLTTRGGAANLSGIEIWKGDGPIPEPARPSPGRSDRATRWRPGSSTPRSPPSWRGTAWSATADRSRRGSSPCRRKTPPWPAARAGRSSCRASRTRACSANYVESGRDAAGSSLAERRREAAAQALDRRRREVGDAGDRPVPRDDRPPRGLRLVVAPARPQAGAAGRPRRRLAAERHRPVRPGPARGTRTCTRTRGRPPDLDPPALLRPDRPAARARRRSSGSSPIRATRPTRSWSIGCSPRPITASAGRGTGWMSSGSARARASSGTTSARTPGATATG